MAVALALLRAKSWAYPLGLCVKWVSGIAPGQPRHSRAVGLGLGRPVVDFMGVLGKAHTCSIVKAFPILLVHVGQ